MVKPGDTVKVLHIGPVKDDDAHVDLYKKELSDYQVSAGLIDVLWSCLNNAPLLHGERTSKRKRIFFGFFHQ
jgi:hypothetical protein